MKFRIMNLLSRGESASLQATKTAALAERTPGTATREIISSHPVTRGDKDNDEGQLLGYNSTWISKYG